MFTQLRSRLDRGGGQGPSQGQGLLSPPRLVPELLLLVGVTVVQVLGTVLAAHNQPEHGGVAGVGLLGWLMLVLAAAAVPLRHRFPVGVLAFTFTTTLLFVSGDRPGGPVFAALIVALWHVVLLGRRSAAIVCLTVGYVLFTWLPYWLGNDDAPNVAAMLGLAAWLVALFSVAEVTRIRRERAQEAARSAEEAQRRQAADERVRMARDLHDSVAHNMSLISIQAGVALHLLEEGSGRDPEQVKQSLATIKEASKEALVELRSILGVLRHVDEVDAAPANGQAGPGSGSGAGSAEKSAPRAPVPSLDRLDSLVERARTVGLDVQVEVEVTGGLGSLPRPVDLAAFRIVQESLTNVSRHSDSRTAKVRIRERDGLLTVNVTDEGTGEGGASDIPGGGNGLIGMRERAAAVGGRLEAGPRPGQGFVVRAELPLGPEREVVSSNEPGDDA